MVDKMTHLLGESIGAGLLRHGVDPTRVRVGLLDAVPAWAAETLRMIEAEGVRALTIAGDVTASADCEAALRKICS